MRPCWINPNSRSDRGSAAVWHVKHGELHRWSNLPGTVAVLCRDGSGISCYGRTAWQWRSDEGRIVRTMLLLPDGQHAVVDSGGHFAGSPGFEEEFLYVVQTDHGQETLTPADFAKMHGWQNDPSKVRGSDQAPRTTEVEEPK